MARLPYAEGKRLGARHDSASLERWYAERGSRDFPGVFVFAPLKPPPLACHKCGAPAKKTGRRDMLTGKPDEALCADCWPRVAG